MRVLLGFVLGLTFCVASFPLLFIYALIGAFA